MKTFNPWPVSLIAFFSVAICSAVAFVIFCNRHKVDLVAADYYEQEVHYQDQLDRVHRAASLQAAATVRYDEAARRITVSLPASHRGAALKGWIQLYRPSSAKLDQTLPLQLDAQGTQAIDAAQLSTGLWHVRMSWKTGGADYYYDQKVIIGLRQVAQSQPDRPLNPRPPGPLPVPF
ncbi:MAG TPA: FixH family protein [Verrucomicrobiae bacterium]|nr:FixH family protein [Verrucomicrobiae bacterium]